MYPISPFPQTISLILQGIFFPDELKCSFRAYLTLMLWTTTTNPWELTLQLKSIYLSICYSKKIIRS